MTKAKILIMEKSTKSRDPYVLYHNNKYYYCFSRDNKIYLSVASNLDDIKNAKEIIVYDNPESLKELWAPELHVIDNKCYIYVACDDSDNKNHRMYVLYNDSKSPINKYKCYGKITDESNKWAIDGTILKYKGELYFIWSGCEEDIHYKQELFIAKMKNPYELASKKVLISSPEYDWERNGGDGINLPYVNEGPAVLKIEDKVYVVYSASGCWCKDYCLGLLELISDNPLDNKSWKKYDKPVFSSNKNIIGPGHCSFVNNYIIFHSFNNEDNLDLKNVSSRYMQINYADFVKGIYNETE